MIKTATAFILGGIAFLTLDEVFGHFGWRTFHDVLEIIFC